MTGLLGAEDVVDDDSLRVSLKELVAGRSASKASFFTNVKAIQVEDEGDESIGRRIRVGGSR